MTHSCPPLHFSIKSELLAHVDLGTRHVSLQGHLPALGQYLYVFLGTSKNNFSFKIKQNLKEKKNTKKNPNKKQTWSLIKRFWTELKWSVNFLDSAQLQYEYVKIWISVHCYRKKAIKQRKWAENDVLVNCMSCLSYCFFVCFWRITLFVWISYR